MNSKTILRNTAWYGLENVISFGTSLITSIAIARTLGPSRMGYIVYVTWIVTITSSLGSVGIPATTRKYMSEFLGGGDTATARLIYSRTLTIQAILASVATAAAVFWVLHDSPPEYRVAALLLVLSTWPAMVNFVSAQANVATESLSTNVPASALSALTFFVLTLLAVLLHWGVIGIASAMLSMRVVDFSIRFIATSRRIFSWPKAGATTPADLSDRMRRFALQSVMGMVLTLIVWDRSELFLLKHLTPDIRQIAFYSVALGLAERLLIFPSIFAASTGASILAQYGRDRNKLPAMTAASVRYLALSSIPIHLVATALVGPALLALYGGQYRGALLVAAFAPILCLPKAFLGPIQSLFESNDQQRYFLIATVTASFVDLGVAWWLIPSLGALGACIGSGLAQTLAVGSMWTIGVSRYGIELPWRFFGRLTFVSVISALCAFLIAHPLPSLLGVVLGGSVAVVVFSSLVYVLRVLEREDFARLYVIAAMVPKPLGEPVAHMFAVFGRRMEADRPAAYKTALVLS